MLVELERELWLYIIVALALWGAIWGLRDTRRVIEAPFLYAIGVLLILCPQLYVITFQTWRVPQEAFRVYCLMIILCSLSLYWGYFSQNNSIQRIFPKFTWSVQGNKLFKLGLFFATIGSIGYYQLAQLGDIEGLWEGWAVYWVTLARLVLPGLSFMVIAYIQSPKFYRLLLIFGFAIRPIISILFEGRRSMTLLLPLLFLLPFIIYRPQFRLPRWVIILALLLAFTVVYAFPYWRSEFKVGNYSVIQSKPIGEILENMFVGEKKTLEVIDGAITTGAYFRLEKYNFGISEVYNKLVHLYVPGGLIGRDFKNSLFWNEGIKSDWVTEAYGIPVKSYTAKTAYTDLFGAFSFFGAYLMYLVGYFYRRIHHYVFYWMDGRAIIFLCFFFSIPAYLPYGYFFTYFVLRVPEFLIILVSFKFCLAKQANEQSSYLSHATPEKNYLKNST